MEIIIKPVLTEKMTIQGEKLNRYGFIVDVRANKLQEGRANNFKKAIVTLKDGDKIDFYSNI